MAEHLYKGGAFNGAGEEQSRGRAGLLEAPAEKSGNLPGLRRDRFAFRRPTGRRKVTTKQPEYAACVFSFCQY
jgi:hypothetical protein